MFRQGRRNRQRCPENRRSLSSGYRYRDFLVLARTSDLYHDRVERIFRRYGIPCFSDYRRPMTSHPAAETISALFGVFRSRWSHESIFRLLKTDLFPVSRHDIDDLENYCLAYGIQGRHWLRDGEWTYGRRQEQPQVVDEREEACLQRINDIRQRVRDILFPCWNEAQESHCLRDWCTLLYRWLCRLGIPDALRQWQEEDEQSGLAEEGKEHEQVWKRIGTFLNEIVSLCGDDETDLDEFSRIVEDGLGSLKFSLIPPTLDHVTLTAVERGYTMQAKVVFLCGVNDGIFPQHSQEEGLFSDKERHRLADLGIVLGPGSRFRSFQERFLFYLGATRASERFVVSYVVADDDGSALEKASWIHQLCDKAIQPASSAKIRKCRPVRKPSICWLCRQRWTTCPVICGRLRKARPSIPSGGLSMTGPGSMLAPSGCPRRAGPVPHEPARHLAGGAGPPPVRSRWDFAGVGHEV